MTKAPTLGRAEMSRAVHNPSRNHVHRRIGPLLLGALALIGTEAMTRPHAAHAQNTPSESPQTATVSSARFTIADIESADYQGGGLPSGQSAITAKVQILLDRSGISPGVVDGWRGGMSESAIKAFQRRAGLPMDGQMGPVVWQLLQPFATEALTMEYTITEEDSYGLVDNIPADYGEKARMTSQGYTSIEEKLAERFHMDEKFLVKLNPGIAFVPGATIQATVPAKPIRGKVARIIIDKATRRVAAYDAQGRMIADYPATVGSDQTPSPHGTHTVDAVALDPVYTYNPNRNFKQGDNDRVLTIPPGPNGPVGNVWIDLSQPTYGIHGTATPSKLFVNQSNGCVRLTNWDARELAGMVQPGKTVVEFLAPGVSIADVAGTPAGAATGSVTVATAVVSITAVRPIARPRIVDMTTPQATPPGSGVPTAPDAAMVTPAIASQPVVEQPTANAAPEVVQQAAMPNAPATPVNGGDPLASAIAQAVGPEGVPADSAAVTPPEPTAPVTTTTLAAPPVAAQSPQPGLSSAAPPRRRAPQTTEQSTEQPTESAAPMSSSQPGN